MSKAPEAPVALIFGCGYLGRTLATRLLAGGIRVLGTTRSREKGDSLAALGVEPLYASVTEKLTLAAALKPALACEQLDVYYLLPPGRPTADGPSPQEIVIGGAQNVQSLLDPSRVRRVVMTSSTGVYGQQSGERVDADTPAEPSDERGHLLLEGEQVWLDSGFDVRVVRLAGLYGPGRVVGLQAVREGAPLVGDPDAWLNLIHIDDAAELLLAVMHAKDAGRIELGSDGTPVRRIEYYEYLAKRLGAPPVRMMDASEAAVKFNIPAGRLTRASSKQCDNVTTCIRTGWLPRYPTFRDGLRAIAGGAGPQAE
ncbi:MAG: NAD-dependent epimerase/dehydratase family protein [Phycisphaeraceae bacterium]